MPVVAVWREGEREQGGQTMLVSRTGGRAPAGARGLSPAGRGTSHYIYIYIYILQTGAILSLKLGWGGCFLYFLSEHSGSILGLP